MARPIDAMRGAAAADAVPVHIGTFIRLPSHTPRVTTYLCGEEALLHQHGSGEVVGLTPLATFAWLALAEGWSEERIVNELTSRGVAHAEALALLVQLDALAHSVRFSPAIPAQPMPAPTSFVAQCAYRYLDSCYTLALPPALAARVEPLLAGACIAGAVPCTLRVEVVATTTGLSLRLNGWDCAGSLDEAAVTPLLIDSLRKFAYRHCDYLMALHSALLVRNGKGILLPGASGSGKSTLAAAMMAHGCDCATDEVVVLARKDGMARTMPFGIGLKAGSWPLLAATHPGLSHLPVHTRLDGREIRYLPIQGRASALPVSTLVFPTYRPGTPATLKPLDPVQALQRLTEAGYDLGGTLDSARLEAILAWISPLPAYRLVYSDLAQAVAQLEALP